MESPCRSMRSCTCAEHHIRQSFTSIFASLVNGRESNSRTVPVAFPSVYRTRRKKIVVAVREDSSVGLRLNAGQVSKRVKSCLFTSLSSRTCVDKMVERSCDRSSSAESQPKFPGCSHFRRRNDNHFRCQQCRLNEGQALCTQDRPCLVCKDWLPEAWAAQAKANAQKTRRKAAAAAKKASEREAMDDSVEIHAPEETLQLPSKQASSDGSSKAKRTKTKATSSGSCEPKSVVSAVERPSSHGSDRRRSRSAVRKRRHGADKRQDSPRHHLSRRDSGRREDKRSCPSSSGGSSSRRRAESSSVSKASDTRPSASSSHHRHYQSSGNQRSL